MSYKTIIQKSYNDIRNEYEAAGAITPGHLVALDANGQVAVNGVAAGSAPTMFAVEDELQGGTTRTAYAAGDQVQTWYVQPGEEVLAIIDAALNPAVGDLLEVSTAGQLQAAAAGVAMFQVLEAKEIDENSNHRILVRRI